MTKINSIQGKQLRGFDQLADAIQTASSKSTDNPDAFENFAANGCEINGCDCSDFIARGQLAAAIGTRKVFTVNNAFAGMKIVDNPLKDSIIIANSARGIFKDCSELDDCQEINGPYLHDVSFAFTNCVKLTSLPVFNSEYIEDYFYCFAGCESLPKTITTIIDISNVKERANLMMFEWSPVEEIYVRKTTDYISLDDLCANSFGNNVKKVHIIDNTGTEIAVLSSGTRHYEEKTINFYNDDSFKIPSLAAVQGSVISGHSIGGKTSSAVCSVKNNPTIIKNSAGTALLTSTATSDWTSISGFASYTNYFDTASNYQYKFVSDTNAGGYMIKNGNVFKTADITAPTDGILNISIGIGSCVNEYLHSTFWKDRYYYHGEAKIILKAK